MPESTSQDISRLLRTRLVGLFHRMTLELYNSLRLLHSEYVQGRVLYADYEVRRVALVDGMTGTKYQADVADSQMPFVEKMGALGTARDKDMSYSYERARLKEKEIKMDRFERAKEAGQEGAMVQDWEIFHAAANNNIKRLGELVGAGVPVNIKDSDTGSTPLIIAASRGQKQALMWLVEHGADVNAQNHQGMTALHNLVMAKQTILCTWLVKQGADIDIEDSRQFSSYDMALPWMQNELKEARDVFVLSRHRPAAHGHGGAVPSPLPTSAGPRIESSSAPFVVSVDPASHGAALPTLQPMADSAAAPSAVESRVMKIYLKNNAYKTVMITSAMKAGDVCSLISEKLGMGEFANSLELMDCVKTNERRVDPNVNVFRLTRSWPVIISTAEDPPLDQTCRLKVVPIRGCSETVAAKYRSAMYGK